MILTFTLLLYSGMPYFEATTLCAGTRGSAMGLIVDYLTRSTVQFGLMMMGTAQEAAA